MTKKIAFIRKTLVPLASVSLLEAIRDSFPEYEVELIDITEILKTRLDILVFNGLFTLKEYWLPMLRREKRFKDCFFRTRYIFHSIKRLMTRYLADEDFVFSVQMQSLYDASRSGLPHFVYTDHTHLASLDYPDFERTTLYPQWWIELERSIYENATMVFTRSTNITRSLVVHYGVSPHKVACVYAGSNIRVHPVPEDKDYANKQILFVGTDWDRKGGPALLASFELVLRAHPTARLTIVGCSPVVQVPNCNVVGRIPLEQVHAYYDKASVFCLPTRREPFGIAIIEALTYKLPVVATSIGAIPDFVTPGRNGYLVAPDDSKEMARAIVELLGSPEKCKQFGGYGYDLVREKYTWEHTSTLMKEHVLASLNT